MAIDFRDDSKAKINLVYKPSDKIKEIRKQVYKRYAEMKNGRGDLEAQWDRWEKQYEAWRPVRNADDWQSNITPPFTTAIVEKALAEIVDQTIQPKIVARGPEDKPRAQVLTYIKDYTWEIGDGDLELYASLKQALILGKTIWQEDFWQDKREVKVLKKFDLEKGIEEYVEKEVDDFNDIYGETVNLRNFYLDPMARTVNRGRYKANDCIRRYIMNIDTLRETFQGPIWNPLDAVKYVKAGGDLNYYQFYKPPEGIDKDNEVEVLIYWGRRPDKMIVMVNDVVIRDGPNPYNHKQLPFAEGSDVPRLHKFWARGEPELLQSIQDELTTLRRMRIDRQHMDIWKMFLVSNRETLDEEEAIVAPSRFLYVDDPKNSIVPLEYRDINASAYREEELLKQDGREVTGVESPQPAGTATEAAIFKESTMKALRTKIWLLSRELLTGIIRLRVPNIVQFYSTPRVEKIVGEEKMAKYRTIRTTDMALEFTREGGLVEKQMKGEFFFEVSPELITPQYGGFDYKLSAEPTFPISKPLQQQKVNELMQHPIIAGAVEAGHYDLGKLADAMMEINDFDSENFKAVEEEQPLIDQTQLLELANRENEMIARGTRVEPLAFANRAHTDVHLAFMDSENFIKAIADNPAILSNMVYHIMGEGKAQELRTGGGAGRGGQGQAAPAPPGGVAQGIEAGAAKAAMPGRMLGPETPPVV